MQQKEEKGILGVLAPKPKDEPNLTLVYSADKRLLVRSMSCRKSEQIDWSFTWVIG